MGSFLADKDAVEVLIQHRTNTKGITYAQVEFIVFLLTLKYVK